MDVKVLSKLGQAVSQRLSDSALVGNSMLVRLRSGTIALLGLITAVGLALVIVIAQQGWPGVSSGPLPPRPPTRFVQHETIALPVSVVSNAVPAHSPSSARRSHPRLAPESAHPAPEAQPQLTGLHQVAEQVSSPAPVVHPPSSDAGSQTHSPPASSPSPASTPPPATTVATVPPPEDTQGSPVTATAEPESEDESPGHSGGYHGHSSTGSPWTGHGHDSFTGAEEGANEDDAGGNEESSDDEGSTDADEHCDHGHGRPDWAGH